jgi:hypothetical protein
MALGSPSSFEIGGFGRRENQELACLRLIHASMQLHKCQSLCTGNSSIEINDQASQDGTRVLCCGSKTNGNAEVNKLREKGEDQRDSETRVRFESPSRDNDCGPFVSVRHPPCPLARPITPSDTCRSCDGFPVLLAFAVV